jgi:tetratricopeptide (TPR) repeat protein
MISKRSRDEELAAAVRMAEIGDFTAAEKAFMALLATDKRNAGVTYNLGLVKEHLGDVEAAAALQSRALALDPKLAPAARRLSRLLAGFELARSVALDTQGLAVALGHTNVNLQPAAEAFNVGQAAAAAAATVRDHTHEGWRILLSWPAPKAASAASSCDRRISTISTSSAISPCM